MVDYNSSLYRLLTNKQRYLLGPQGAVYFHPAADLSQCSKPLTTVFISGAYSL